MTALKLQTRFSSIFVLIASLILASIYFIHGIVHEMNISAATEFSLYAIITIIILTWIILYFNKKISTPLRIIAQQAHEMGEGKFSTRSNLKTGNEIEEVSLALDKSTEALSGLEKERNELDAAKTQFLNITSHELRSPMTPLKAQIQMLDREYFGKLNKKQKNATKMITRSVDRLDNIVNDLLDLSRIEAARLKFRFEKVNLTKNIENLAEEMKGFLPEKKIKITTNISSLPTMEVDIDRTMQIVRNLLTNALKFSKEKSTVTISAKRINEHILLGIKDSGEGIAPENKAKVFEPFFEGDNVYSRRYGGAGLGLTLAKGLVEAQGGKIWFESELGKGSIFYFNLPTTPVKEIKPIRLLFTTINVLERRLEEMFKISLGPVGSSEFEELKENRGISKESISNYIDELIEKNIISKESGEKFRSEVNKLFGESTAEGPSHIEKEIAEFFKREAE